MDTQTSSSTNEQVKKKPGPTPKPKVDINALEARVHNLEELVSRMAHQSGVSHAILIKAGLTPYTPTKNDMTKFKKVG
jgi:hypothetical protein